MDGTEHEEREREVRVPVGTITLDGTLRLPAAARGIVLFAHGSGSSRHSPRNGAVAGVLHEGGYATLLMDLLTPDEEAVDLQTRHVRFDIPLLAERLVAAIEWIDSQPDTNDLAIGLFGASTGAGAALVTAAERPSVVRAVVSRGGRPDLAGGALSRVQAPTLLIVGGRDASVIDLNREAMTALRADVETKLEIVPGATHLFEEPGALNSVARLAREWFDLYLR